MKNKIVGITNSIIIGLVVVGFILIGLKSCVITVWGPPKSTEVYSTTGVDGRSLQMTFMPDNETMIWYYNPNNEHLEGILTEMRGTVATHYIWRLWHFPEGSNAGFMGWGIYPSDAMPIDMEISVLERYIQIQGRDEPVFPAKGDSSYEVILRGKDKIRFQDVWLVKEPEDPAKTKQLLNLLGGSRANRD